MEKTTNTKTVLSLAPMFHNQELVEYVLTVAVISEEQEKETSLRLSPQMLAELLAGRYVRTELVELTWNRIEPGRWSGP